MINNDVIPKQAAQTVRDTGNHHHGSMSGGINRCQPAHPGLSRIKIIPTGTVFPQRGEISFQGPLKTFRSKLFDLREMWLPLPSLLWAWVSPLLSEWEWEPGCGSRLLRPLRGISAAAILGGVGLGVGCLTTCTFTFGLSLNSGSAGRF